jgi:hypothetical protein
MIQPIDNSPHVAASIQYILEMNLDMLDVIWQEDEVNFDKQTKAVFLYRLSVFFMHAKLAGDTKLIVMEAKLPADIMASDIPLYYFYAPLNNKFFNLYFLTKNNHISAINVCRSNEMVFPAEYRNRSFDYYDNAYKSEVELLNDLSILEKMTKNLYSKIEWDAELINRTNIDFIEKTIGEEFHELFYNIRNETLANFSLATDLISRTDFVLKSEAAIKKIIREWKEAILINNQEVKMAILLKNCGLLSTLSQYSLDSMGKKVFINAGKPELYRTIQISHDMSFVNELNVQVIPVFDKFKNSLFRFFERNQLMESKSTEDFLYDIPQMHKFRIQYLKSQKAMLSMVRETNG